MTAKESIYILRNSAWLGSDADRQKVEEAVEVVAKAIEALEAQNAVVHMDLPKISEDELKKMLTKMNHQQQLKWIVDGTIPNNFGKDTNVPSNDTISRHAALDAIKNSEFGKEYEAVELLPSAQPEQRWIPCSERLPVKDGEMYLVTISDGSVYSFALKWDINRKRWYLSFLNDGEILIKYIDDVIAWMPLPEEYRGEQDENR